MCGSDGVTYGNLCKLQEAACFLDDKISVVHHGECEGNLKKN